MRPLNRAAPQLPASAMTTYRAAAPTASHYRPGSCAETGCPAYQHGWTTTVDEASPFGARQAAYIRGPAGRAYRETRTDSGLTRFTFEAGQPCFRQHLIRLDRPFRFLRLAGDWRRSHLQLEHSGPDPWVDDMRSHTERLARQLGG